MYYTYNIVCRIHVPETYAISPGFWFTVTHKKIKINCYLRFHQTPKEILDWHGDWNVCTSGLLSMPISDTWPYRRNTRLPTTSRTIAPFTLRNIIFLSCRLSYHCNNYRRLRFGYYCGKSKKSCFGSRTRKRYRGGQDRGEKSSGRHWDPHVLHSVGINWITRLVVWQSLKVKSEDTFKFSINYKNNKKNVKNQDCIKILKTCF